MSTWGPQHLMYGYSDPLGMFSGFGIVLVVWGVYASDLGTSTLRKILTNRLSRKVTLGLRDTVRH